MSALIGRDDGRIPDIWLLGFTQSLERTHPEMSARERFVAAVQHWRDQEQLASQPYRVVRDASDRGL